MLESDEGEQEWSYSELQNEIESLNAQLRVSEKQRCATVVLLGGRTQERDEARRWGRAWKRAARARRNVMSAEHHKRGIELQEARRRLALAEAYLKAEDAFAFVEEQCELGEVNGLDVARAAAHCSEAREAFRASLTEAAHA